MSSTLNNNNDLPEGTRGPHASRVANAADPRVDSDADHRAAGQNFGTTGGYNSGTAPTTAGPHGSDMMNKMDPRVDSDLDGSRTVGGGAGNTNRDTVSGIGEGSVGPHSNKLANTLDPRVDSDADGSRTVGQGAGTTGFGSTGTGLGSSGVGSTGTAGLGSSGVGSTGTAGLGSTGVGSTGLSSGTAPHTSGPHDSDAMNKMDPRVDADQGLHGEGKHGHHGGQHGSVTDTVKEGVIKATGPAPHTAGPHKSDLLNKLDPRVDSDLDHSKTIGGNKTFSQS